MKKVISLIIAIVMIMAVLPVNASELFYSDITIMVDGNIVDTGTAYVVEGRTYYPVEKLENIIGESAAAYKNAEGDVVVLRQVCEELGMTVTWINETHTVSITTKDIGNKYYVITNVGTGKVLAAEEFSTENNARLVTADNDNSENVVWRLGKMGDMTFNISNAVSGKSIDVPSASKEEGKGLITYTSNGNSNQSWQFEEVAAGTYMLSAKHSGLYMDASGEAIVQAERNDSDYQKWTVTYVKDSMLSQVIQSEGFKLVAKPLQDGFKRYMFGSLPACYTVANNAESYFIENDFKNADPKMQAEMIKTVSSYTAYGQVTGDKLDQTCAPYKIVREYVDENYDIWRGAREKCWIYEVEMDGDVPGAVHKFIAVSNEENSEIPQRMIEALGAFPYAVRQYVKRVIWKWGDNANNYNGGGDTIWARLNWKPNTTQVMQTLAHELGHILDTNQLEDMMIWSTAEAMDAVPVSGYGSSNQAEDLAEMHRLYWTTLGRETEKAVEEVYPNRLKVLKGLLYRADKVHFEEFAECEQFILDIKAKIDGYGNKETAGEFSMDKYYKITDSKTGLAWTVENSSLDNTAKIVLEKFEGKDNQLFYVENAAGFVKFYNKNSNIPVQLHTSAMYNKPLTQYGGTWAVDERLEMEKVDGGYKMHSKRYSLDVSAVTAGVGDKFIPYVAQDGIGSVWVIEECGDREGIERYAIKAMGKYLSGNPFGFESDEVNDNSTWLLTAVGEDTYTVVNMETGKAIDISGGSGEAGAKLITYDLSKNDNQLFYMEEAEGGFNLKMKHSELYLTLNEDGTITQEEKDDAKIQVFAFEKAE